MSWQDWGTRVKRVDPRLLDVLLALSTTGLTLRMAWYGPPGRRPFDALGIALTVAAQATVMGRRQYPTSVFGITVVAATTASLLGYPAGLNKLGPQLAFTTVARATSWQRTGSCAVVLAGYLIAEDLRTWPNPRFDTVFQTLLWVVILWAAGAGVRRLGQRNQQLAERTAALADLTEQLARRNEEHARQVLITEQVRIARELHDVVAHHIAVVTVQAELGSRLVDSDPDKTRETLTAITESGREALQEMRYMLAALRPGTEQDEVVDLRPAPGLDRIPELADRVRAAGVPLSVHILGEPRPLSSALQICAYRVIQESLTNIVKHALPSSATLTVEYQDTMIRVSVLDDGDATESAGEGTGKGLIGMAERARVLGGTLSAGRRGQGGFEVVLTLPTDLDDR